MIDLSAFHGTAWLAEPNQFQQVVARVLAAGRCFTRDEVSAARLSEFAKADGIGIGAIESTGVDVAELAAVDSPKVLRAVKGKVGILPIWGPIQQRMSSELLKGGGTSTDFISRAFDKLMADPAIGAIVLHVDSPGGSSFGIEELSTKIVNARGTKPIYAIADSVAASAAYWLATSADMMFCTTGGVVGSVGVYVMHVDKSKGMDAQGVKVTMISSGKFKTELSQFGELSQEAIDNQQKYVDALHGKFIGALKRNRGTTVDNVRSNYGQGRVMMANDALAAGMIDRVLPFEELISRLAGGTSAVVGNTLAAAQVDVIRMRSRQRARMAV